nr:hypothetical protein [Rhizobium sp. G21]
MADRVRDRFAPFQNPEHRFAAVLVIQDLDAALFGKEPGHRLRVPMICGSDIASHDFAHGQCIRHGLSP